MAVNRENVDRAEKHGLGAARAKRGAGAATGSLLVAAIAVACDNGPVTFADAGAPFDGSANEAGEPGDASREDVGPLDASNDEGPRATACTAPPFHTFRANVTELRADRTRGALGGAAVSFDTCPGYTVTTDASGTASAQVTQAIAYTPLVYAGAHVPLVGPELAAAGDAAIDVVVPVANRSDVFPEYSPSSTTLWITLSARGTPPCDSVSGTTIEVASHPEAKVRYMAAAWPADVAPTSSSAAVGDTVIVTGLASGLAVEPRGAKAGCTVTATHDGRTGRVKTVAGAVTIDELVVAN